MHARSPLDGTFKSMQIKQAYTIICMHNKKYGLLSICTMHVYNFKLKSMKIKQAYIPRLSSPRSSCTSPVKRVSVRAQGTQSSQYGVWELGSGLQESCVLRGCI